MTEDKKVLLIPKIENGIVIDHVPAGFGLKILEIIHSYPEMTSVVVTVGLNYSSSKLGKKDMLKLQTEELPARVLQHIAMVCSGVSIKRIKRCTCLRLMFRPCLRSSLCSLRLPRCGHFRCSSSKRRIRSSSSALVASGS